MSEQDLKLEEFIAEWSDSAADCRQIFTELRDLLAQLENVNLEFVARPGVTYSLRGSRPEQGNRPLFVMVDVIDSDPRWLSVCFYGEMVTDPEELGDFVPGGLLGEDGICFDIESDENGIVSYVKERIVEAHSAVTG